MNKFEKSNFFVQFTWRIWKRVTQYIYIQYNICCGKPAFNPFSPSLPSCHTGSCHTYIWYISTIYTGMKNLSQLFFIIRLFCAGWWGIGFSGILCLDFFTEVFSVCVNHRLFDKKYLFYFVYFFYIYSKPPSYMYGSISNSDVWERGQKDR